MDDFGFDEQIIACKLLGCREPLGQAALPAIRLAIDDTAPSRLGGSRFGGQPDLPPEVDWPRRGDRSLAFLCQLSLKDFSGLPFVTRGAGNGRLWFFLDVEAPPAGDTPNDRAGWRVIHSDCPTESLTPRPWPVDLPASGRIEARSIAGTHWWTLPPKAPENLIQTWHAIRWIADAPNSTIAWARRMVEPNLRKPRDITPLLSAYRLLLDGFDRLAGIQSGQPLHRLGGVPPATIDGDLSAEMAVGAGFAPHDPPRSWRVCLCLEPDPTINLRWAGGGCIAWLIGDQDAVARRYDRLWFRREVEPPDGQATAPAQSSRSIRGLLTVHGRVQPAPGDN